MREICVQHKNKVHHVNQLIEPDLMMHIHMTFSKKKPVHSTHSTHSTHLFKILFSLLTLSTVFLQKASGPKKMAKKGVLKTRIYGSKNISSCRAINSRFQNSLFRHFHQYLEILMKMYEKIEYNRMN